MHVHNDFDMYLYNAPTRLLIVVTGDLNIVQYQNLRYLLCKLPKYEEPVSHFHGTGTFV